MTNNENIDSILMMIEDMLDGAWSIPLSGGKGAVDVDRLRELIEDLKMHIPVEVAKAKEIVNDRKIILDDAKKEAEMVIRVAEERAKKLVDHDEVVKQAQAKANEILSTSQLQARELKKATSDYVDSVLKSTEDQVAKSLAELRAKRQAIKAAKIG
ncbi:MAG: ATPase [Candidatus Merdivicinus sp.]|jgi:organic radical activating enzyme